MTVLIYVAVWGGSRLALAAVLGLCVVMAEGAALRTVWQEESIRLLWEAMETLAVVRRS